MKNQRGFTLVEMILVVALLAVAVGVSGDIILTLVRSYTRTQVMNELEQNANFVTLKLERELKSGSTITTPSGVGVGSNTLTFTNVNGTSVTYTCSNCTTGSTTGNLSRTISGVTRALTVTAGSAGIYVSCATNCFTLLSTDPYTLKVNMTFSRTANLGEGSNAVTIDNTLVLRGSY